ncbi:MAG: hypothetical protein DI628_08660 [Blastochloris viridis]|uniref:ParB/Sulfiredoxin domain-containing protein n=1 Tax=Blastochloris viridis TaxID=1079 RepID=A0A6N4R0R1_BLAVI|nr:MAG: hypothetical protein DI628_08660 [Blastochloris viridis]
MSKATKATVRKPAAPAKTVKAAPAIKAVAEPKAKAPTKGQQRQVARNEADVAALKAADEGFKLARENAVKYLHSRRQAIFALARHFHLDADDLQQEAYEVLLTCLRDFNPLYTKADGTTVNVQFNTFFGNRLEGKALEQRNRDPEYQARQAHLQDMSDEERTEFRKNPPLLVQHLDQETTMQETLRGEVAAAQRSRQTNMALKVVQDTFIERKLNDLIAAERDDKRRAALMHVKVGGVSSFEEIAYHFGVTDSRASQILNELMDAFYVQRLIDGDLKSVMYDFRKLSLQPKRTQRLLEEAMRNAPTPRAAEIANLFMAEYPDLREVLGSLPKPGQIAEKTETDSAEAPATASGNALPAQLTPAEEDQYPLQAVEWREIATLTALGVQFRPTLMQAPEDMAHIRQIAAHPAETWAPLIVTPEGGVIDGERRIAAARAKGITRLLCQVRTTPSAALARQLRVCLNSRVRPLDKLELYFAIGALSELGLTQGVIAQALGTSRPNVIVYAKVREKASPRLRQLFEDGLIQITNASSAVDLPVQSQDEMADFIRQYGAGWGRGPQFNELYAAAAEGQIAALVPPQVGGPQPSHAAILPLPSIPAATLASAPVQGAQLVAPPGSLSPTLATALKKRQEALETALRDSEIWARQREATITSQTSQIHDLRQQVESYKRELEAQTLLQHGDAATMANYMKELKAFYAVQERLASAIHQLEKTHTAVRSLNLTHRQTVELEQLLEKVASLQTALRVQLVKSPTPTPENTR